jgi:preprotein translocase subunit SecG
MFMPVLIGLLTLLMVVDCVILILLVLIQLPKKEAGAGLAFGGGATDALFGAGSGTVLTKITKYAAGAFFVMAMLLSVLQINYHRRSGAEFTRQLNESGTPISSLPPMTAPQAQSNSVGVPATNALTVTTSQASNVVTVPAVPPTTSAPPAAPAPPK